MTFFNDENIRIRQNIADSLYRSSAMYKPGEQRAIILVTIMMMLKIGAYTGVMVAVQQVLH